MNFKQLFLSSILLLFTVNCVAIDYDKYKKRKARQQVSVLEHAKKAANDWEFEKADKLLKQAQNMAYAPDKVEAVGELIGKQRFAKSEKERKEREALAEKKRKERLARKRQQERENQRRYSSSNSPGSSSSQLDYVMVNFSSTCGFALCSDKNLSISGGPGSFSPSFSGAASGAIHKGYNGLAGRYNWSAQLDNKTCSGSFNLSGRKRNLYLSVYDNCSDAGFNEH